MATPATVSAAESHASKIRTQLKSATASMKKAAQLVRQSSTFERYLRPTAMKAMKESVGNLQQGYTELVEIELKKRRLA